MFKRVSKQLKRKEREEELGIAELKQKMKEQAGEASGSEDCDEGSSSGSDEDGSEESDDDDDEASDDEEDSDDDDGQSISGESGGC